MMYMLLQHYMVTAAIRAKKDSMCTLWRYQIGEVNDTHPLPKSGRPMPYDIKKNYIRYSNFHQVRKNKRIRMIHLNWWCRDQNFRKYFEMRKKNGIKPSLHGFYHEKIYDE